MTEPRPKHRPIRSFVLRTGRMTPGQEKAFAQYWPTYGVDFNPGETLDFSTLFGNERPMWVEIGFGDGESLATMARDFPQRNYLGIEVHTPGVGRLLLTLAEQEIGNVRIMSADAMEILQQAIAPGSLAGVQLFFPDPWHKKKHHKRRIVQPRFVELMARLLQAGGIFHAATDWEDYARHMLRQFSAYPEFFENLSESNDFVPQPDTRPTTKFERRGQRLGHGVWDLMFKRTANPVSD
ncbi:tRNA (guanosine(46)-N7)-methyltransferase TrmB [Thiolapillus sp.]